MRNTDVVLPSAHAIEPGYATFILVLYSSIVSGFIFFYYLFLPVISLCAQQTTLHPVTVRKIVKCKESTQVQAELDEFNP